MTTRPLAAVAGLAFAIGILTGSVGTILVRDASATDRDMDALMAEHMGGDGMLSMMGMMSGSMMGQGASTMPMHGPGYDAHHAPVAPAPTN